MFLSKRQQNCIYGVSELIMPNDLLKQLGGRKTVMVWTHLLLFYLGYDSRSSEHDLQKVYPMRNKGKGVDTGRRKCR